MNSVDERNIDPITEMTRLAKDILLTDARGFRETFRSSEDTKMIFDSKQCRVGLVWTGWDYGSGNTMHIFYGRLHASNVKKSMFWEGEECNCWHRVEYALHFLDGRTPTDTAKLNYSHHITKPFYAEESKKIYPTQPEWMAHMHATIWEQYSQRLFELFDLHRPELWKHYQQFLKNVYDIKGRSMSIQPALDKVC